MSNFMRALCDVLLAIAATLGVLSMLGGCVRVGADGPAVVMRPLGDVPANASSMLDDGVLAWVNLGFHPELTGGDECPREWYSEPALRDVDGFVTCAIYVDVEFDAKLREEFPGIGGLTNIERRRITIDPTTPNLAPIIAHEFGHLLLDTSEHIVGGGRIAVMNPGPGRTLATDHDYALACRTIGVCP